MFDWYDYLLVFFVLFTSTMIGIYFGCFGSKQSSIKEYLSGGKQMKILPIALSVTVSHFSAILLIAVPADVYKYGAYFWLACFAAVIFAIASMFIYYPVLFRGEYSSIYEYLETRFDQKIRMLGSTFYVIYENLLLPVIVYTPALGLSVVTGINLHLLALIICGSCVFYTAVGGLRTVIWTDIFQFVVVITALLIVCNEGITSAGGVSSVWNKAVAGQRLDIFDFDLDPTKKDSFWICTLGFACRFLFYICLSQSSVQKYLSLSTLSRCRWSLSISALCWCLVTTCAVGFGLIIYANYYDCDPAMDQKITKNDQIVAYYVEQIAKNVPGISGLFMAAVLSSAISTLSSSLNSLSGVIYNDFIKKFSKNTFTEERGVTILKIIVVIEGIWCTCMVFVFQHMGDILPLAVGITGMIDGPSVGLYTLGILFPRVNSKSAFYGTIGGVIFIASIYFPSVYYKSQQVFIYPAKPLSIDGCNATKEIFSIPLNNSNSLYENFTYSSHDVNDLGVLNSTTQLNNFNHQQPSFFFRISYNYYCLIGAIVTVILGLIISYIIDYKTKSHPDEIRPVNLPLLKK